MVQSHPRPVDIAREHDFGDESQVRLALIEMQGVPEHELHQCVLGFECRPEWSRAAGLSKAELDRLAQQAIHDLAMKTTRWAVSIGAVAAIAGAIIGALLQAYLA